MMASSKGLPYFRGTSLFESQYDCKILQVIHLSFGSIAKLVFGHDAATNLGDVGVGPDEPTGSQKIEDMGKQTTSIIEL